VNSAAVELSAFLPDEAATLGFGEKLAQVLQPGLFVALSGELGSGKTTLARGMLRGLGYEGKVKSPTYTLVEHYKLSRLDLYHFDFYRFKDSRELLEAGFRDDFDSRKVCLIEWPERAQDLLPIADLSVSLMEERGGRRVRIAAQTELGKNCLARIGT